MDSQNSCGKSSAKKFKGFTLIELIVVMAIIAILAGIASGLISGYVRDARLETANNKAQQVYTAVQNTLIQFEINQDISPLNAYQVKGDSADKNFKPNYVYLQFTINNGTINGKDLVVKSVNSDVSPSTKIYQYDSSDVYPYASDSGASDFTYFKKLTKYLADNLSADFTGFCYVCIDIDNYVVDTAFYTENTSLIKIGSDGLASNLDKLSFYYTKSSASAGHSDGTNIVGCDSVTAQKTLYKGKDTARLDAASQAIGYYPMMGDLTSGTYT
jgi:prepilin-type N-terminal cleavage/methylation domain-containing protein